MTFFFSLFRVIAALLTRMPFPFLYFLSDLFRFVLQNIIQYRKEVIYTNLTRSFPEKSSCEIRELATAFYRNLADVAFEVIKLELVRPDKLLERFEFTGLDILKESFSKGRSVIITIGHCGNWEWMGTVLGMLLPVKGYAIIKPLAERRFDKYLESLRHRFNPGSTINFHHTYRAMIRNKNENAGFYVFAADQTPTKAEINHWGQFLNQETPFYTGVEKLSRSLDLTVVFIDITRTGRGKYCGEIRLITDKPKDTAVLEITGKYISLLEDSIRRNPDNWLWSHRRWKFERSSPQS
jgi:KDO2-lipid IV(A) lauroyltransferase